MRSEDKLDDGDSPDDDRMLGRFLTAAEAPVHIRTEAVRPSTAVPAVHWLHVPRFPLSATLSPMATAFSDYSAVLPVSFSTVHAPPTRLAPAPVALIAPSIIALVYPYRLSLRPILRPP